MSGYAQTANERLGAVDFVLENTGKVAAYIRVKQFVSATTTPSGYSDVTPLGIGAYVGPEITVAAGGCVTRSFNLLSKRIGFFGSGVSATVNGIVTKTTTVNISAVLRNKSDLRGAQIDISQVGRQGWGFDQAFNTPILTKKWGSVDATTGALDPNGGNFNEPTSS
ncbi:MAG: hypothetical protein JZU63_03515 [Rhodoferax sp.]|nr:hypothetical protein [Rhodoferax sp.]